MQIIENPIFGAYLYDASYDPETKKVMIRVPKPFFFSVRPFTIKGESISKHDDNGNIIFHYFPKRNVVIICSNGKKKKLYRDREYSIMVNPQSLSEATITDLDHLRQILPR
ncbi:MAG: hypothetical protein K5837_05750 [Candidatus Saccharibacteria bacterium]|nr:hypothetical protein [Candidatus Saccharibacteria bacterium]